MPEPLKIKFAGTISTSGDRYQIIIPRHLHKQVKDRAGKQAIIIMEIQEI